MGSKASLRFVKIKSEKRHSREPPPEVSVNAQSMLHLWGHILPVQMESCDLSVVSLKVNEVEKVHGRLFISLLSGKKEAIMPWTQTSAGSLRRLLRSTTRGKGKCVVRLLMYDS